MWFKETQGCVYSVHRSLSPAPPLLAMETRKNSAIYWEFVFPKLYLIFQDRRKVPLASSRVKKKLSEAAT